MKRFLIVAFTLLWGVSALAGEPFFCTKAGSKLYYERYKTKTNKMIQTTEFEVDSLVNAGKGKRPLFGGRASLVTTWTTIWKTGMCRTWATYATTCIAWTWTFSSPKSSRKSFNDYFPRA